MIKTIPQVVSLSVKMMIGEEFTFSIYGLVLKNHEAEQMSNEGLHGHFQWIGGESIGNKRIYGISHNGMYP